MNDRTIRIAQRCTPEEAAAMMAAIRTYERERPGAPRTAASPPAGADPAAGAQRALARRDGSPVLWTRSEKSLGRGL